MIFSNNLCARTLVVCVLVATIGAGCGGNKPKRDQIFLMPAPDVYEAGEFDPFIDNDPISRGVNPGILFATDRQRATPDDKKFRYFTFHRGQMLHLGEAHVKLGTDGGADWEELKRISLLKDRTENYPLEVESAEIFGVLESTIPLSDDATEHSAEPAQRFFAEIDQRLDRSRSRDVYIYVHGYRVDFENPVLVSAELWHFLGYNGAFIAYSWPTKNAMFGYFADLDSSINSARYLRTLILDIARNTTAERIHVIGYSAGTRLVGRMIADFGIYGAAMSDEKLKQGTQLGKVILIGADIDQDILAGYLYDGALRIPNALTLYVSESDSALRFSRFLFRGRERAGELLERRPLNEREQAFFEENPNLRIIDVSFAEGGTGGNGHSYFRSSPWVSSDLLTSLLYDLSPEERGLVLDDELPVWEFPADYISRLRQGIERRDKSGE